MPVTVVVGMQWGDEGKGKIVDCLGRDCDVAVRYQGGANAGHTVVIGEQQVIMHLLPSGILREGVENVIGNGLVVDPVQLLEEIDAVRHLGVKVAGRLFISDRAHVVFPYHRWQDQAADQRAGDARIGTTQRGIGPAYADKVHRHTAFRFADLTDPHVFRKRLERVVDEKNRWQEAFGTGRSLDAKELGDSVLERFEELREHVCDTSSLVRDRLARGKRILMEGAHGTLLDVDFGTYPYVTSSNCSALAAPLGVGIPLKSITDVVGVMKAYCTRVGEGPFPTELRDETGDRLRETGGEYGATTGRPRRCGWYDAIAGRYTVDLNGADRIALTKLDVLDGVDPIQVCTGYRYKGKRIDRFPSEARVLQEVEPVYESFPGWKGPTSDRTRFEDLPEEARSYVSFLEGKLGVPVSMVSIGRRRDQVIMR